MIIHITSKMSKPNKVGRGGVNKVGKPGHEYTQASSQSWNKIVQIKFVLHDSMQITLMTK